MGLVEAVRELRSCLAADVIAEGGHEATGAGVTLRPRSTDDVARVLATCNRHRVPVVPQGGLTGLVRGASADGDSVALSLSRMRAIEEIDVEGSSMAVQAGAVLQTVQEAADAAGLLFPLDLGARGSATIGGNIATNAGGNRVIRYGMMRDLLLGVEAVLADGSIVSSMKRVLKDNAGYDLKQLFVGSEGTLGVVTRAVLRVAPRPSSHCAALVAVDDYSRLLGLLSHVRAGLGSTLSAFEVMWRSYYELVSTPPAPSQPPLPHTYPYYVLLETLGCDPLHEPSRFEEVLWSAREDGLLADAAVAKSAREIAALWAMREDVLQASRLGPFFIFDVSLGLRDIESYLRAVETRLARRWPALRTAVFGHLGDGNIHLLAAVGRRDAPTQEVVERVVYDEVGRRGGSISAEHGIGLEKKAFLDRSRSSVEIALMRRVKAALDPNGILNPGKVI